MDDRNMDRRMNKNMDSRITEIWTDGWTEIWTDGWTEIWTDKVILFAWGYEYISSVFISSNNHIFFPMFMRVDRMR